MKSIAGLVLLLLLVLLFLVVPVSAQETDFSQMVKRIDDTLAFSIYKSALRDGQEQDSCRLFLRYERLRWVEEYSIERPNTLGKLGIKPESVGVLRLQVAKRLAESLMARLEQGNPPRQNCSRGFCAHDICGDSISSSPNSWLPYLYNVADLLEDVLRVNPIADAETMRIKAREYWRKSVIEESSRLKNRCLEEMKGRPRFWRDYKETCSTLKKALKMGIKPSELGLSPEITKELLSEEKILFHII